VKRPKPLTWTEAYWIGHAVAEQIDGCRASLATYFSALERCEAREIREWREHIMMLETRLGELESAHQYALYLRHLARKAGR
jgi:hypothetical protein